MNMMKNIFPKVLIASEKDLLPTNQETFLGISWTCFLRK